MYLGSDAIALAPFTDTITYLEDGDWAVVQPQRRRRSTTRPATPVERAVQQVDRRRRSWSTRATTAISWRRKSTSSRRSSATRWRIISTWRPSSVRMPASCRSISRKLDRISISACGTAYLRRAGRQILVRALRAAAGRDRCRVRIPLPRGAVLAGRPCDLRVAVGRDRRHAGVAALRQGAEAAHPRRSSTCRPRPSRAKATW